MPALLSPPVALLLYLVIGSVAVGLLRALHGVRHDGPQAVLYASGEAPARDHAAPGYQPFFGTALFFALLHVGVLIASIATVQPVAAAYAAGVLIILLVVVLA